MAIIKKIKISNGNTYGVASVQIVELTYSNGVWTSDKDISAINSMYNDGEVVICKNKRRDDLLMQLISINQNSAVFFATTDSYNYKVTIGINSITEDVIAPSSLALGETSSTAYRGDRGKTAYDHSRITGNPHGATASDVGALPDTTSIPTKTSDLTNDSGYITQHQDISGKADKITVSAADNGKFMRVVNGAWAAAVVPDANGVSF